MRLCGWVLRLEYCDSSRAVHGHIFCLGLEKCSVGTTARSVAILEQHVGTLRKIGLSQKLWLVVFISLLWRQNRIKCDQRRGFRSLGTSRNCQVNRKRNFSRVEFSQSSQLLLCTQDPRSLETIRLKRPCPCFDFVSQKLESFLLAMSFKLADHFGRSCRIC